MWRNALDRQDSGPYEDGVRWIADLCARLQIPTLRAYGVTREEVRRWSRRRLGRAL
jgi:alcohol dehydrogenase class IV